MEKLPRSYFMKVPCAAPFFCQAVLRDKGFEIMIGENLTT